MNPEIIRDRIKALERQIANLETDMRLHRIGSRPWARRDQAKKRLTGDIELLEGMLSQETDATT